MERGILMFLDSQSCHLSFLIFFTQSLAWISISPIAITLSAIFWSCLFISSRKLSSRISTSVLSESTAEFSTAASTDSLTFSCSKFSSLLILNSLMQLLIRLTYDANFEILSCVSLSTAWIIFAMSFVEISRCLYLSKSSPCLNSRLPLSPAKNSLYSCSKDFSNAVMSCSTVLTLLYL